MRGKTCGEVWDEQREKLVELSKTRYLFARLYARYWLRQMDAAEARQHAAQMEFLRNFMRS